MNNDSLTSFHRRPIPRFHVLSAALALCSISTAACDTQDDAWDAQSLDEEPVEPSEELEFLAQPDDTDVMEIAQVRRGDSTYYFINTGGGIGVGEVAPVDADGILDRFKAADATALEMYVALSGDAQDVPVALLDDHAIQRASRAQLAVDEPVRADVSVDDVRDLASIVAVSEGLAVTYITTGPLAAAISDHYDATCTLAADGQTYFDGLWQSYGWNWHWYSYKVGELYEAIYSAITGYTTQFRGHSCNNAPEGSSPTQRYKFQVLRHACPTLTAGDVSIWSQTVQEGYRAVYYQTSETEACTYWVRSWNSIYGIQHSLGLMAP